jgi:hypothetical protein
VPPGPPTHSGLKSCWHLPECWSTVPPSPTTSYTYISASFCPCRLSKARSPLPYAISTHSTNKTPHTPAQQEVGPNTRHTQRRVGWLHQACCDCCRCCCGHAQTKNLTHTYCMHCLVSSAAIDSVSITRCMNQELCLSAEAAAAAARPAAAYRGPCRLISCMSARSLINCAGFCTPRA